MEKIYKYLLLIFMSSLVYGEVKLKLTNLNTNYYGVLKSEEVVTPQISKEGEKGSAFEVQLTRNRIKKELQNLDYLYDKKCINSSITESEINARQYTEKAFISVYPECKFNISVSGSNRLGRAGGYSASNNFSVYGNNHGCNYVSNCPHGGVVYRFEYERTWHCLNNYKELQNTQPSIQKVYLKTNDKCWGDNSGKLDLSFEYEN